MRYLFNDWDKVSRRIKKSSRVFLFFDYDGTLTPIVSMPEDARFPLSVKNLIKRLKNNIKFDIAIVSGRSLKDIKKMAAVEGLTYAGNHGLEIERKGRALKIKGASAKNALKRIKLFLKKELSSIKGAWVEDKGYTLSVHFRGVKRKDASSVKKIFRKTVLPYVSSGRIRVSSGKKVLEARPAIEWDKGKAVLHIIGRRKGLVVYLGDDVTDMDAFRVIRGKGISIFVGRPRPDRYADYFLNSPKEVEDFIRRLVAQQ